VTTRRIIACGGDGWPTVPEHPAIEERILALAGRDEPRVLLVPTASGDNDGLITRFYEFFNPLGCRPDHLPLFRPHPRDVEAALEASDVVYVGGGSTANMLAIWRAHGVDRAMRRAYERGVVLSGVSAGAICWFEWGLSNSLGHGYSPVRGLGLLPGGFCPHLSGDPARRPALADAVARGNMPDTHGVDDGAALVFEDERLVEVVVAQADRTAVLARRTEDGTRWTSPLSGAAGRR
jgi:peptidase E